MAKSNLGAKYHKKGIQQKPLSIQNFTFVITNCAQKMLFNSYSLFIYIASCILLYGLFRYFSTKALFRNIILLGCNLFISLQFIKEYSLIVLGALSLLVFIAGLLLQYKKTKAVLASSLSILLILFAIRNYPFVQDIIQSLQLTFLSKPILSVQKIGLSYILFRYIHWLVESYKRKIHKPDFLSFLNYIFFFPNFLAGPIDQYNHFRHGLTHSNKKYSFTLFWAGIARVFMGAVKTLLIVPLLIPYALDYKPLLLEYTPITAIAINILAYSMYIFLDFSGYSDIAIGTGYMLGIKTPENFNSPYLANNISDFWKRWHMTFSFFLRIYVFKPILQVLNSYLPTKNRLLISILAYLGTFVLCGLWHGDSIHFVYWGLWHGIGLAIYRIWKSNLTPLLSLKENRLYTLLSTSITFVFVSIGWVFFQYNSIQLKELFQLIL